MAKPSVQSKIELDIKIAIELTLSEARALNEMVKYGSKPFLEGYYKQLGKSYLKPYEDGVVSLFDTVKQTLPFEISKADEIIKAINNVIETQK